ncbi:MAG: choice-of-anchor A family protein [Ignavibacteriaceae bacterium]|nr:choice-of-anchor A family protein [Ignavibacteriaceae bacterium]
MFNRLNTRLLTFLIILISSFSLFPRGDSTQTFRFEPGTVISTIGTAVSTARVLNTDIGINNVTFTNPYNPAQTTQVWSGNFAGTIDGNPAKFFCIDLRHYLAFWTANNPHVYTDSGVTPSQITYILMNYYPYRTYPYPGSASSQAVEAAAIQIAIWHYADGLNINTVSASNATTGNLIKNRALQIKADADANSGATVPIQTLIIYPTSNLYTNGQQAKFKVRALNQLAQPAVGVTITLATSSGTLSTLTAVTDATGYTPEISLNQGGSNQAQITASAQVIIPQGTRYVHNPQMNTYQKLVLATPTIANRQSSVAINWSNEADLSITKIVNISNPPNNSNVTYTLNVLNSGPAGATGVVVSEILPQGVVLVSANPGQGSFDPNTGLWTIGSIANGSSVSMTITVTVNVTGTQAFDLGAAEGFNVFILEDIYQPSSDTEGKMAAGRDIFLSNYSVGDKLPANSGDVLVAGRHLIFVSGDVFNGNAVYGETGTVPQTVGFPGGGSLRQDSIIDFESAAIHLRALSTQLGSYAVNGRDTLSGVSFYLNGSDPFLNVFEVTAEEMTTTQEVYINVPNGSVALVNVTGDSVDWGGNLVVSGTSRTNALFNFYEARTIRIAQIDVTGSILAPFADVHFVTGVQHGQMIAKSMRGQAQYNLDNFIGNMPVDTVIVNVAQIIASDQVDPDSNPGTGGESEDDYASVNINVSNVNPAGGGSPGTIIGNWTLAGTFGSGEFVWTFKHKDNFVFAGTWGGKVYRSTDNGANYSLFNASMAPRAYIWAIDVNSSGHVFVATESGVFKTTDNGTSFAQTSAPATDVRALCISTNGNIFAGTWGSGIYRSQDNGSTWLPVNQGLSLPIIHSMAIDSSGTIYAGTFGAGVFKSTDNGDNWQQLPLFYPYIWSLGVAGNGVVLAGTYGNGLFVSYDGGSNWERQNNGINSNHIYSIVVAPGNNIFVSGYNAGVYFTQLSGADSFSPVWNSIGLSGANVSSIIYNPTTGALIAGLSNGAYLINSTPTSIKKFEGVDLPSKFELLNNYPNPFNPSTVISFSIPVQSKVNLIVYNTLGEIVAELVNGEFEAGQYSVSFDARTLPSGVYIYRLNAGISSISKKMILQK